MHPRIQLEQLIRKATNSKAVFELSVPDRREFGHYSTNIALRLAKEEKKNPVELAHEIAKRIQANDKKRFIGKIEVVAPGFINVWISGSALREEFLNIRKIKETSKLTTIGKGKKAIIEYASTNIAKEMHVGHLRNTFIGDALANCYDAASYTVVRWNYLGDWGTQFGKVIVAYKKWGNKKELEQAPVRTLLNLYVRFNREAKTDGALDEEARKEFKKLEDGDKENLKLWQWFCKESIKGFGAIFDRLGVHFDTLIGESFFGGEMDSIVQELLKKHIAVKSEGAIIVPLDAEGLPPAMAQKSDGASLYLTRDLALLRYRLKKYKPAKILHVVGNEQSLHFEQVIATAQKMRLVGPGTSFDVPVHVKYGLVLGETGRKFSTREGEAVFALDVVEKAVALARSTVEAKRPELSEKEKDAIAEAVGIGALKYTSLRENKNSDITFDWDRMLDFSGESGPYLQYTYARLRNILRKADHTKPATASAAKACVASLEEEGELALIRKMIELPTAVELACDTYAVNAVTLYLYELANLANTFYESTPILSDTDEKRKLARLLLVQEVAKTLKRGLGLLGISAPEKI